MTTAIYIPGEDVGIERLLEIRISVNTLECSLDHDGTA